MLNAFHRIARILNRLRALLWLLLAAVVVLFLVALFAMDGNAGQPYLLGSVIGSTWLLSALCVARGFADPLPVVDPASPFLARTRIRLWRAFLWLMALLMCVVSLGLVFLSARGVAILMGG